MDIYFNLQNRQHYLHSMLYFIVYRMLNLKKFEKREKDRLYLVKFLYICCTRHMTFENIMKHNIEVIKDGEMDCLVVLEKIKPIKSFVKVQTVKFIYGHVILIS